MADLDPVLADLRAESEDLDALVSDLPDQAWPTPTPAAGWTIAHQIAHLAWTDRAALLAVTDPEGSRSSCATSPARIGSYVDDAAAEGAAGTARRAARRLARGTC